LLLLGTPLLLGACTGPLSSLDPAGPAAQLAAGLWWGMFAFAVLVLAGLSAVWLHAMRRDPGTVSATAAKRQHKQWIWGGGVILPTLSIVLLLAFGIPAGHRMLPLAPAEGEALKIEVTAHQWYWQVRYPDDDIELVNSLHIPVDTPIDIHLRSADVIHSFWVPRLAGKLDTIPGRTNVLRLAADLPGEFRGQCAEFCGVGHAHMPFTVTAHTQTDFARWRQEARADD